MSNNNKNIDRRQFIKSSAAVGASLILVPHVLKGGKTFGVSDINVALLGAGAEGQVLMNACLKIPGIRFKAVCDIWSEYSQKRVYRLLRKYGHELNKYEDYKEMLAIEKDLDAVIIATPDFWHAEHATACLEAGLHVYCEKEMSNTLEGARQIVEATQKSGKLLQVGHQRRSNPRYIHCYENIIKESKMLGRITTINGQWNRAIQPDLGWPDKYAIPHERLEKYGFKSMAQFRNWRWYKGLGGGPVVDLGSHQIDIYSWFLDAVPSSVMASGGTDYYDKKTHEWYDTVMALFEFDTPEGKVRASYQTITTNSNLGYFENFMGDKGTLQISESAGRAGIYREQSAPLWDKWVDKGFINSPVEDAPSPTNGAVLDVRETVAPPKYELPITFNDPYHKPHLENFFNSIRGTETLNCPAEVGYETAVAVLKVNEAVENASPVKYNKSEFVI
ncbi:MAG: Gfo/Idh/MocA family oxidoreductase [Candidatus Marinimicrobia bacterium]|jgi:predicted dehydrogenase|nr:Gfo/Idh/MocA family oxidoreductase [Candidatus Neomarinimicrobiota bacterium]MBT3937239.1 Gfo/Idh/MocA family oxidoreductase [Candidatus Neomarinimicrobiota bacterium]MBT3961498.1 Gfo/Idh/MocA family oxidoreductase [Candidatus Neomarinimicrobiota bacterium]MBT4635696.1 Gfo/Idh/MocA family oxidoreductase [Candidatus Neomarinimicrobiota bacterium]MBT4735338.1 Gfo/Idh/MocA family oxidoreductase [Candidatus Neomarinimicrobiota bacterium]